MNWQGTQAAIGVRPFPLDDNILKSTFCAVSIQHCRIVTY